MSDAPRWNCLRCGGFYDAENYNPYCPDCQRVFGTIRGKRKAMAMKMAGKIPESHRRRGYKAYLSRVANLYFTDREKFNIVFQRLSPGRKAAVTRMVKGRRNAMNRRSFHVITPTTCAGEAPGRP